jgi:hypothetical protein
MADENANNIGIGVSTIPIIFATGADPAKPQWRAAEVRRFAFDGKMLC